MSRRLEGAVLVGMAAVALASCGRGETASSPPTSATSASTEVTADLAQVCGEGTVTQGVLLDEPYRVRSAPEIHPDNTAMIGPEPLFTGDTLHADRKSPISIVDLTGDFSCTTLGNLVQEKTVPTIRFGNGIPVTADTPIYIADKAFSKPQPGGSLPQEYRDRRIGRGRQFNTY